MANDTFEIIMNLSPVEEVDTTPAFYRIDISSGSPGATNVPQQEVPVGTTSVVIGPLTPGDYTVAVTTLDANKAVVASNGVPTPPATAVQTIPPVALSGQVVQSITINLK